LKQNVGAIIKTRPYENYTPIAELKPALKYPAPMETEFLREFVTGAMKFWEPRCIVYNAALETIVIGYFVAAYPDSKSTVQLADPSR
jgi:hypothetical protein